MNQYYEMFRLNFPFVSREDKTIKDIMGNKENIFIEKKNEDDELIGLSIVNQNTILMLCVNPEYRCMGIGEELLNESEKIIQEHGFSDVVVGVGFDYLAPGVPTSKKYADSVYEKLEPSLDDSASTFFENRGYIHSWKNCNCFDMFMSLSDFDRNDYSIGDTINQVTYRWANRDDMDQIVICADDACQYQEEKFSKYYKNPDLYREDNPQRVLVALKGDRIVGTLIISRETEGEDLGCVGCTCVSYKDTHQKIGTTMVMLGTKYLKDIGLRNANLSYTYSGLDNLYGYSGYRISCYYMMAKKKFQEKD